jgi:AraC-like DNA-binding protein
LSTRECELVVPIETITARAKQCGDTFVVGKGQSGLRVRSAAFLGRPLTFSWLPRALLLNASIEPSPLRQMTMALVEEMSRGTHAALCPLSEAVFVAALDTAVKSANLDMELLLAMNRALLAPEAFGSVNALARAAGLSRSRLSERFTLAFGEPPMRWLRRLRMEAASAALAEGRSSVAEVAETFGYSSESAFRKSYRRVLGEAATASRARRKAH